MKMGESGLHASRAGLIPTCFLDGAGKLLFNELFPRFLLWCSRRFSAVGLHPLLVQSFQELLLRPNREIRVARVFLPISLFNEGNGIVGGANLCVDLLTPLRPPMGFD